MGLPLLTWQGRAFAARMAASLLTAIGLEDCIATSLDEYIAKAVAIGTEPAQLARLKAHLSGDRWARTLGDSHSFTRRIEAAYRSVVRRPCRGMRRPPAQARRRFGQGGPPCGQGQS